MVDLTKVFQRMDETIADVCLRELDWGEGELWRSGTPETGLARVSEAYRLARPLILHLIKSDKSPMKNMKKLSIARSMIDAGKKNMESHNPYDALNMYNKAVVFAPNTDDNLGKACSERAACLLLLGDYKRALMDIEQADQCEYQFEKRFELEERRGLAHLGLKQFEAAREAFAKSISLLEDAAGFLPRKFVERKMQELQDHLKACIYTQAGEARDSNKFANMKKLPELKARNKKYPALSEAVDMGQNSVRRRALYSVADVSAGEVLAVEKPIASFLEKEYIRTNCWHCLVTIKAPYGCPLCSAVKFCSRECLREACSTYHPFECLLTDIILSNRIGSWHLAFRAVASRPLEQCLLIGNNGISQVYCSSDLNTLLHLDLPRVETSVEEVKKKSVLAVFYLILLQMTGYFDTNEGAGKLNPSLSSIHQMKGKENDSTLSEAELHIGVLLERIMSATSFCTTEVCHFEMRGEAEWTAGKVTPVLGKTINPTLALVNHSCYPTAARVCWANQTLLVAQKNIKPGESITINYSAPFYAASRVERRQFLHSGYILDCECEACRQDWPLFDHLPPGPQGLSDLDTDPPGFRSVDLSSSSGTPVAGGQGLTGTERGVLDTFNRVRSRLDLLQASASSPPSKVMIQNQVRLFRCLLAMYSSKLYVIKTEYGRLSIPV